VIYPESIIPERFSWILQINPMYHFLHLWRDPIYGGTLPATESIALSSLWAFGTLFVGWWVFSRHSHQFALRA
jgi:ABC-type polysaccharide/polyol phosphate export permease